MTEETRKSEADLAEEYNQTHDISGFDEGAAEPVEVRRNVTISVRFSEDEIAELRRRADELGVRVTALIRTAALENAHPRDWTLVWQMTTGLEEKVHELAELVSRRP